MLQNTTLEPFLAVALAIGLAIPAPTQQVVLSEVMVSGDDRWIELHNRGSTTVELSTWALYHASMTAGMPQNYWWGFPAGTTAPAGGFLRVHWFRQAPTAIEPGNLYTGTAAWQFLFGLGGEALRSDRGALALLNSRDNALMNSASVIEDWVSWGTAGFRRETLAVQVGRWTSGRFVDVIAPGESIARNVVLMGAVGPHDREWFHDPTPTPLAPNVPGLVVQSFGQACTALGHHLLGTPGLQVLSSPIVGNRQFALRVSSTTGLLGETVLMGFTWGALPNGGSGWLPPIPGAPECPLFIDPTLPLGAVWVNARPMQTDVVIPLLLPALVGLRFQVQALVLDHFANAFPPYQGTTNALDITIGG